MPNGGPDNCGGCAHNQANQEMAHSQPTKGEHFRELSYCNLRDVNITVPYYTYCSHFGGRPLNPDGQLDGWIYAGSTGDERIPWNDKNEPHVFVPAECVTCGQTAGKGIVVEHAGAKLEFCSNRHYVQWWKTIHEDDSLNPEPLVSINLGHKTATV